MPESSKTPKGNQYETPYHWRIVDEFQRFGYEYQVEPVLPCVGSGCAVLDIGCGDGRLTYILADVLGGMNVKVVGTDYQKQGIAFAREQTEGECDNLEFCVVDHENPFPVGERNFSLVTMFDVIEHIHPDLVEQTLKGVYETLNKEGHIYITTPNPKSLKNRIHGHVLNEKKHYKEYEVRELIEMITGNGLYKIVWVKGIYVSAPVKFFMKNMGIRKLWFKLSLKFPFISNKIAVYAKKV